MCQLGEFLLWSTSFFYFQHCSMMHQVCPLFVRGMDFGTVAGKNVKGKYNSGTTSSKVKELHELDLHNAKERKQYGCYCFR